MPSASSSRRPAPSFSPTSMMVSPVMAMSTRRTGPPVPSARVPFRITRSAVIVAPPSTGQCPPAEGLAGVDQLLELRVRQGDGGGGAVLLEMVDGGGAGDGEHHRRTAEEP